ncbi:MAG: hypothetical protein ACK4K7_01090 [Allosphingosinicella sp.]|uniref:hypothetical protein n=1 Tax=Allosphingosinicella sp. TaxID=2823234 RepID=UPI00395AC588
MDMGFHLRAEQMLGRHRPAEVEHDVLMAALGARQAASPTARAARRNRPPEPGAPIVELLLAGPGWREAAQAQQGCFHPSARADTAGKPKSP